MNVVVIGSGIVGSCVAYELAKAGAKVTLLESARIAGGASAASFAWTNANGKRPRPYHALNVAGMRAYIDLAREFGTAPWFYQTGSFEWWTTPQAQAQQRANVKIESEWGYGIEWIDRKALAAMEPDLDCDAVGDVPIVYYPEEGWVDPVLCVAWLLRAAADRWGLKAHEGARVTGLETQGGRVCAIRTDGGKRFEADAVVNCTGGSADQGLDGIPAIPMKSTIGILAFTPPVATTLRRQFHADDLDVRPDGSGRLMIHKIAIDDLISEPRALQTNGPEAVALLEAARAFLPVLDKVGIEAIRTTVRPIPGDGLPCAGRMPEIDGYYVAVTHSGVTIAPQLGKLLADEIVRGASREELSSFRPARFFSKTKAPGKGAHEYAEADS